MNRLKLTCRDREEENSVVEEVTSVLREWGVMWQGLYLRREEHLFSVVRKLLMELMEWRRQILSETLVGVQFKQLKQKVTSAIDYGNRYKHSNNNNKCIIILFTITRILGLDLVVRDEDDNIIDAESTGVIELYKKTSEETKKRRENSIASTYCIYVNIRNVICNINDDAQVFTSLYDAREGIFISEQFLVEWDKAGMPKDIEKLYNLTVLFTDLGSKDLKRDRMYLVCKIVRRGRIDLKEPDNKKLSHNVRRSFGIAGYDNKKGCSYCTRDGCCTYQILCFSVLYIGDIISGKVLHEDDKEFFLHLFTMSAENQSFDSFVKKTIQTHQTDNTRSSAGQGIWVSIKVLDGNVEQIQEEHPLLITKHTAIAKKQGFPEVIMPGDYRNDLYITISQGEFEKGKSRGKKANKNIEVTMHVLLDDGSVLPNVINYGAGEESISEYRSNVFYHQPKPEWSETIKVVVPIEQFEKAHLRFTFKHRSTFEDKDKAQKIFAFAFMRLMNRDGTTLTDGTHDLLVYKCDLKKVDPSHYLKLASLKLEQTVMTPPPKGYVEYSNDKFTVKCLLCSTKLTQNLDLLGLLKWKQMAGKLKDILVTVMKVSGEEIVKFLTDIFDALFGIVQDNARKYDKLVFDALVFTINLLADKKYHHFRPVLDAYIEKRFGAVQVHRTLIKVLKEYIQYARLKEVVRTKTDQVLRAMKAIEYVFKFIVKSRLLYDSLMGKGKNEFQEEMRSLFIELVLLMEDEKNETLLIQGASLKYFPASFADLLKVFDAKELGYYARDFIEKIPERRLTSQKMDCIHNMIKSPLFENEESRCAILPMVVKQLGKEMERNEEMKICIDILSNILVTLMRTDVGMTHEDVLFLVTALLRVVVKAVIMMDRKLTITGNYVACLTAMLQLMDADHFQKYMSNFSSLDQLRDFLMELFLLFREFVSNNVYPKDWIVMTMVQNRVILNAIQNFSGALCSMFLRGEDFEVQLWNNFFHLAVAFITQESLQLENFSSTKQERLIEKYSDMRTFIGFKINEMWDFLGAHKTKFIPSLVGPFLEMTLLPQKDLRRATIPIFFDMIEVEYRNTGGFVNVETELFRKLDVLVEGGKGDEEYKELFQKTLTERFSSHPQLSKQGIEFVQMATKLLERLLDYRTVVQGDDNNDNRMSCTVNVLNFYKDIRREEMFIRYVYKLCDLHLAVGNFTEAAYTLRMHADLLEWSDEIIFSSQEKYQASSKRQLREMLYEDIVKYFDKGKCWEEAIAMCKELARQYEEQTFEYIKLSQILNNQALFYDNIITQVRGEPEYFRVAFYGKGFPTFLRDKVFVYRGKEYERLGDFVIKLQSQYPSAENLTYLTAPKEEITDSNGQHMQINKVDPVSVTRRKFHGKNVMEQITKFYDVNHVNTFQYSRKFHQGQKEKDNEFKELISPLQYALETMKSANKELRSVIGQQKADSKLNINPLSMKLQGIVEAAVMGGTANFEKVFLIPEYLQQNSEHEPYVEQLKELLVEQIDILEEGVHVHAMRVSDNLRPLHELIEQKFKSLKQHAEPWRKALPKKKKPSQPNPYNRLTIQRSSDERPSQFEPIGVIDGDDDDDDGWYGVVNGDDDEWYSVDGDDDDECVVVDGGDQMMMDGIVLLTVVMMMNDEWYSVVDDDDDGWYSVVDGDDDDECVVDGDDDDEWYGVVDGDDDDEWYSVVDGDDDDEWYSVLDGDDDDECVMMMMDDEWYSVVDGDDDDEWYSVVDDDEDDDEWYSVVDGDDDDEWYSVVVDDEDDDEWYSVVDGDDDDEWYSVVDDDDDDDEWYSVVDGGDDNDEWYSVVDWCCDDDGWYSVVDGDDDDEWYSVVDDEDDDEWYSVVDGDDDDEWYSVVDDDDDDGIVLLMMKMMMNGIVLLMVMMMMDGIVLLTVMMMMNGIVLLMVVMMMMMNGIVLLMVLMMMDGIVLLTVMMMMNGIVLLMVMMMMNGIVLLLMMKMMMNGIVLLTVMMMMNGASPNQAHHYPTKVMTKSEQFLAVWDNAGMPKDIEKLHNVTVLFTDLGCKDLKSDKMYLVFKIVRRGRIDLKEPDNKKIKKLSHNVRRSFGIAGGKKTNKNVEVTMHVLLDDGSVLPNVINYGVGEESISEYRSNVFYHQSKPEWSETIKVVVPIEQFEKAHLRFTFKHRCTFEDKDKAQKIFAFAFMRLMNRDGTTLTDGTHDLLVYKFLTDIFDALFGIVQDNARKYDKLVFDALVFTINLLADKKYHHFRPVLDAYIEKRFGAVQVHHTLIKVLKEYIQYARLKEVGRTKTDQVLRAMKDGSDVVVMVMRIMKAIEYLFKFIVKSRLLYDSLMGKGKNEFQEEMRSLFIELVSLMEDEKNETLLIQGASLKYFPASFADLLKVFDAKELGLFVCVSTKDSIIYYLIVTCSVSRIKGMTHEDVLFLVTALLRVVVKAVIMMDRKLTITGNYVACLTAMLQLMDADHFQKYMSNFSSLDQLRDFLMELFLLFREFVSDNVYPKDWVVMTMVQNRVILNAIQNFSGALCSMFLRGEDFEAQLWNNFFHLAVAFITQESLQLENFSSTKQERLIEKYSDMRTFIGFKINEMWDFLGAHKTKFIPSLVGPFLEMTLLPQKDLRRATIPIFFDMIEVEYRNTGGFVNVETELFRKLDVLVEGGKGDEEYKELFQKTLTERFIIHPQLSKQGIEFVQMATKLLERLLDYRTVVQGDDNNDNRMSCTVNVLNFYKDIRREEMFIRYVYKLCDLHLAVGNFTEAAYTLRMHADLLEWSDEIIFSSQEKYQASSKRQLREMLYEDIIKYFNKGKCWEEAIAMCKELARQYEEQTFEYIKLSQILNNQAEFYDNIITQVRGEPEYFRVAFYGKGFPTFLRDKVFVYRGKEYERLGDFVIKLQSQYPSAENLTYLTAPKEEITDNMQINKVDPVSVTRRRFHGKNVMEQITKFYDVNHVNTFQYSRKFHQGQKEKDNEFKTMWLERTVLYTRYRFPGILCWFEVTNSDVELISPLQYALETMKSANKELRSVIGQQKADAKLNINPLSMKLQGIVEAAVMGGTANFEKAFLIPEYLQQNSEHQPYIEQLKELLVEQIDILEEGIHVHAMRISDNLRPLHELIENKFKSLKQHAEPWRKPPNDIDAPPAKPPRPPLSVTSQQETPPPVPHTSLLRTPRYCGHLSNTDTSLYYGHLVIADTSLLRPPRYITATSLYYVHLAILRTPRYITDTSLYYGHLAILRTPRYITDTSLYCGHLAIADTSLLRTPRYYGHLAITDTSLFYGHLAILRTPRYITDTSLYYGHLAIADTSLYHGHLAIADTSLLRTPRFCGDLAITRTDTSLLRTPRYCGHHAIADTTLLRTPRYYGHHAIADSRPDNVTSELQPYHPDGQPYAIQIPTSEHWVRGGQSGLFHNPTDSPPVPPKGRRTSDTQ
ncbi:hypothetical protein QZH41_012379, partial [Actinostola sp. cb2023]